MSFSRAKKMLSGMRFHHLGFCFFWAVSFVVLSGLQAGPDVTADWRLYLLAEQVITFLVVGGIAWMYRKRTRVLPSWLSLAAGFMLSGGALLYFLCFYLGYASLSAALASGILIGFANALFFLLWQTFFVTEGQQRAIIYIPLSAVSSIVLYVATLFLPLPAVIFIAVVALPFLAMLTLYTSLGEIELFPIKTITRSNIATVIQDLWRPVFCVCAIGFVWKLVAQLSHHSTGSTDVTSIMVLAGFGAAALLVALFELFSNRGFDIMRTYQVLFPAITGIFLIPVFFGMRCVSVLTGTIMFGFEVVNLLLLITCAVYASMNGYSPVVMYGICVVPTLVSMSVGDNLGVVLDPIVADSFSIVVVILFFVIYVLSLAFLLVSRNKKPKEVAAPTEDELVFLERDPTPTFLESLNRSAQSGIWVPSNTEDEVDLPERVRSGEGVQAAEEQGEGSPAKLASWLKEEGLSPREIEVVELLIKGNSVAAISRKLFISENTTRGHTKSIYLKLGIHSRQELIDMCEEFG